MTDATRGEGAWAELRRRKVVQWGIAYAAGAWGFLQGLEYVSEAFGWPGHLRQVALLALLIGLPITLFVATAPDVDNDVIVAWERFPPAFHDSPGFKGTLERLAVTTYWRAHGYPPQCRAVGNDDFTCD